MVDARATAEEEREAVDRIGARCRHQRRHLVRPHAVGRCLTLLKQQPCAADVVAAARGDECRALGAVAVLRAETGGARGLDEQRRAAQVALSARKHQRRLASVRRLARQHVGPMLEENLDAALVVRRGLRARAQQRREALVAAPAGIGAVLQQKRGNLRVARTA